MIFVPESDRPLLLASVANLADANAALSAGADIIDAKNPSEGALGALPHDVVAEIAHTCQGKAAVSATIGDLPADSDVMVSAALEMANAGVDIVKVGFFGDSDASQAIRALGTAFNAFRGPTGSCLVAVLMADRDLPIDDLVRSCADARFFGVMLDTADKARGPLTSLKSHQTLQDFIVNARAAGLFAGLAGSLRLDDVNTLVPLQPDALGFRSALCDGARTDSIQAERVADIRWAIDAARQKLAAATSTNETTKFNG